MKLISTVWREIPRKIISIASFTYVVDAAVHRLIEYFKAAETAVLAVLP